MTDTHQAKARLANLSHALDTLDAQLEPLFSQSLTETSAALQPLQRAKLHALLPYLIYDLVFIYLKTQGVDPRTHPVISELERVKQYFDKITTAETSDKRRMTMDTEAANRFIKHALTQAEMVLKTPAEAPEPAPSTSDTTDSIPVKITEKMAMRARYEEQLKESAEDEEEQLQVFDDANGTSATNENETTINVNKKRRRVAQDPFAGYGESSSVAQGSTVKVSKKAKNKSKKS